MEMDTIVMYFFADVNSCFLANSYYKFIHIRHVFFTASGAIELLPVCQWSKQDGSLQFTYPPVLH